MNLNPDIKKMKKSLSNEYDSINTSKGNQMRSGTIDFGLGLFPFPSDIFRELPRTVMLPAWRVYEVAYSVLNG